jgi:hypothetical protein
MLTLTSAQSLTATLGTQSAQVIASLNIPVPVILVEKITPAVGPSISVLSRPSSIHVLAPTLQWRPLFVTQDSLLVHIIPTLPIYHQPAQRMAYTVGQRMLLSSIRLKATAGQTLSTLVILTTLEVLTSLTIYLVRDVLII